eukprot:5965379-Amphidinium_carterae.1
MFVRDFWLIHVCSHAFLSAALAHEHCYSISETPAEFAAFERRCDWKAKFCRYERQLFDVNRQSNGSHFPKYCRSRRCLLQALGGSTSY